MATVRDRFHEALALHKSGRGNEAEPVYRELLRNDPAHAYEHLLRQTSESWYDDLDDQTANLTYTTAYNDFGQVASIGDGATEYEYTDQLTGADYDFQTDESYSYDDNGNRTNTGYATGDHNRLSSDGTYNYTYDGEGNVTSKTKISDSTSIEYTWDHRNRLTKVTFKNSAGMPTKVVDYTYDHGQRWIRKTLDTNADGTIEQSQIFVHDQDQIVLDFRKTGTEAATTLDLARRYLWGPAVDQLLADETVDDGTADNVSWVLGDHLNSVRDLAVYDPVTQMVSVVKHVTFDAFGNVTSDSAPGVKVLFLYTARPFDPDSALQNNGFRWYDLSTARWMTADPIGFAAGDVNLYRYAGNRVLWRIDPRGLHEGAEPVEPYKPFFPEPGEWFKKDPEELAKEMLKQWQQDFEKGLFDKVSDIQAQLPSYGVSNKSGFEFKFGSFDWDLSAQGCRLSDASTGASLQLKSKGKIEYIAVLPLTVKEWNKGGIDYWSVMGANFGVKIEADLEAQVKAAFSAGEGFHALQYYKFQMFANWDAKAVVGAGFEADAFDVSGLKISAASILSAGTGADGPGLSIFSNPPQAHAQWQTRVTAIYEKEFGPLKAGVTFGLFLNADSTGDVDPICGVILSLGNKHPQ